LLPDRLGCCGCGFLLFWLLRFGLLLLLFLWLYRFVHLHAIVCPLVFWQIVLLPFLACIAFFAQLITAIVQFPW